MSALNKLAVKENQEAGVMSSIDLREIINVARVEHQEPEVANRHFLARIEDELESELGGRKIFTPARGGTPMGYYDLTFDQCMLVGMRESKAVRRNVLVKLKEKQQQPQIPQTYAAALLEAGRLALENEQQAKQLELAAPKVAFVDMYVETEGLSTFRQAAKLLDIKEPALRSFLIENKVMYRLNSAWTPYQQHLDAGRFAGREAINKAQNKKYLQFLFTAKGINWLAGKINA